MSLKIAEFAVGVGFYTPAYKSFMNFYMNTFKLDCFYLRSSCAEANSLLRKWMFSVSIKARKKFVVDWTAFSSFSTFLFSNSSQRRPKKKINKFELYFYTKPSIFKAQGTSVIWQFLCFRFISELDASPFKTINVSCFEQKKVSTF